MNPVHDLVKLTVTPPIIRFGKFVLHTRQQLLFKEGAPVALGSRAMNLLIALSSRPGQMLEKSELIATVWPKVFVEECNLRAQIRDLRRVLFQDGYPELIVTVPGRGYRFAAFDPPGRHTIAAPSKPHQVIGRSELVQTLYRQLQTRRFVTLLGPGGAGKSTVALALVTKLSGEYATKLCFVDLAPVRSSQLVAGIIASAMGINCATGTPLQSVTESMGQSRFLLILDNCEHLLASVANAVEFILNGAPYSSVLVTSREPLHATGEFVHDLPSLIVPETQQKITSTQALSYSAIQLFVQRVKLLDAEYSLRECEVETICAICRKLDGNALAIEIAAARVQILGIQTLAHLLDGSFRLNMSGSDRLPARHRTLSAVLDWTYSMLSTQEQTLLRNLSIFLGPFTVDAVVGIVDGITITAYTALPLLESMVDKSLLVTQGLGASRRFRLLETTRVYARVKRDKLGETAELSRRIAIYSKALLSEAGTNLVVTQTQAWVMRYGPEIDNIRVSLDWAYSPGGDRELGIDIILLCLPLWLRLSLIGECRDWVDRGLADTAHSLPKYRRQVMLLHTAAASVLLLTYGTGPKIGDYWRRVMDIAIELDDIEYQLRALWGLWSESTCNNQFQHALKLSDDYIRISGERELTHHRLLAKRMQASTLFHIADLAGAWRSINEALIAPFSPASPMIDVHFDQRIATHAVKAHIDLLRGNVAKALLDVDANVDMASRLNHPSTLWYTLCFSALPLAIIADDITRARSYLTTMQNSIARHDLPIWRQLTRCFDSILLIRHENCEAGLSQLLETMSEMAGQGASPFYSLLRCEIAKGFALVGRTGHAAHILEETLMIATSRDERWYIPELLRIKGELMLKDARPSSLKFANQIFNQALNQAKNQGAVFWQARIIISIKNSQLGLGEKNETSPA
jgi:predicted ATPase